MTRAAVFLLLSLVLTACPAVVEEAPLDPALENTSAPEVPAPPEEPAEPDDGEHLEVTLDIVEGPGGGTLAFAPVFIEGEGPFAFALDTGASHSVIDQGLATDLALEQFGVAREVSGVVGVTEAEEVQVTSWTIGDVELGESRLLALPLGPGADTMFQGLLGSDVLSTFGSIAVDYDEELLILRPRTE